MKRAMRKFSETVQIRSSLFNRLRSHRYAQAGLLVTAILLAACVHIWQRVCVLDLVQEVSILRREHAELVDDMRKTNSDIASLSCSARIEQYAVDSLGLVRITTDRLFTIVSKRTEDTELDDMSRLVSAIKRVTTYMPTISQSEANAGELRGAIIDSLAGRGEER